MPVHIALLRGINVGGKNKIKMEDLRQAFMDAGLLNPVTIIQSGNIVFESGSGSRRLQEKVSGLIHSQFGLQIPCVVVAAADFREAATQHPFRQFPEEELYISFLGHGVKKDAEIQLQKAAKEGEQFRIEKGMVFLHIPKGYADAGLSNTAIVKATGGGTTTTRNLKTCKKIAQLIPNQ